MGERRRKEDVTSKVNMVQAGLKPPDIFLYTIDSTPQHVRTPKMPLTIDLTAFFVSIKSTHKCKLTQTQTHPLLLGPCPPPRHFLNLLFRHLECVSSLLTCCNLGVEGLFRPSHPLQHNPPTTTTHTSHTHRHVPL